MDERQAYREKMEAQLREWSSEIDALQARAEKLEAEAKRSAIQRIEALRAQRAAAQEKLETLKGAGDKAWEDLRRGVENAWADLKQAVQEAAARFSK